MLTYKDIDRSILKALPNPTDKAYEIKHQNPECTFLGASGKPDFAHIYMTMYPCEKIMELKSVKEYVFQLRNIHLSYERLANHMFDDVMAVYEPIRYRQVMVFKPRGGMASKIIIDSDWPARGGTAKFSDWQNHIEDEWEVIL